MNEEYLRNEEKVLDNQILDETIALGKENEKLIKLQCKLQTLKQQYSRKQF